MPKQGGSQLRWCVVEDDVSLCFIIGLMLKQDGDSLVEWNGRISHDMPTEVWSSDVVILDMTIDRNPQAGLETCRALRAAGYEGLIYFHTGLPKTGSLSESATQAGADGLFYKPDQLFTMIAAGRAACAARS